MAELNEKTYLDILCYKGHKYKGQDQSLRFKSNHVCVECSRERGESRRSTARHRPNVGEEVMKIEAVQTAVDKKRAWIYALMKRGDFPEPTYPGSGREPNYWSVRDIAEYLSKQTQGKVSVENLALYLKENQLTETYQ